MLKPNRRKLLNRGFCAWPLAAAVLWIAVLFVVVAGAAGAAESAPDTVTLPALMFHAPTADESLGGSENARVVLQPDLPLLQHILLQPEDLREATLTFTLAPAGAGLADVLAKGQAANGDTVKLGDQAALQKLELSADSQVLITVWRHQWHWGGGADLQGLRVERLADHKSESLPAFTDHASVQTELGVWRLSSAARRDQFPRLASPGEVTAGKDAGSWVVSDGAGINLNSSAEGLKMFTWGSQNDTAAFDWAPVVSFEPKTAGTYGLTGTLAFNSGQAADPKQTHTLSWLVLRSASASKQPVASQLAAYRLRSVAGDPGKPAISVSRRPRL